MSPRLHGPSSASFADLTWTAAPGRAELTLRAAQGLLADPAADPAATIDALRRLLDGAGYPTDVLGGMDPALAADLFGDP